MLVEHVDLVCLIYKIVFLYDLLLCIEQGLIHVCIYIKASHV